jgi:hypothetical protein
MEKPDTREELRAAVTGDRYQVLKALAEHEELLSGEIQEYAEIPDGSRHYQLSLLETWDLIEAIGTQHVGEYDAGIPATVYTLTEEGQALVDKF